MFMFFFSFYLTATLGTCLDAENLGLQMWLLPYSNLYQKPVLYMLYRKEKFRLHGQQLDLKHRKVMQLLPGIIALNGHRFPAFFTVCQTLKM